MRNQIKLYHKSRLRTEWWRFRTSDLNSITQSNLNEQHKRGVPRTSMPGEMGPARRVMQ
jgi:hypothetical protein